MPTRSKRMYAHREKARLRFIYKNAENVALFFARIWRQTDLCFEGGAGFALINSQQQCTVWAWSQTLRQYFFSAAETNLLVYAKSMSPERIFYELWPERLIKKTLQKYSLWCFFLSFPRLESLANPKAGCHYLDQRSEAHLYKLIIPFVFPHRTNVSTNQGRCVKLVALARRS